MLNHATHVRQQRESYSRPVTAPTLANAAVKKVVECISSFMDLDLTMRSNVILAELKKLKNDYGDAWGLLKSSVCDASN